MIKNCSKQIGAQFFYSGNLIETKIAECCIGEQSLSRRESVRK